MVTFEKLLEHTSHAIHEVEGGRFTPETFDLFRTIHTEIDSIEKDNHALEKMELSLSEEQKMKEIQLKLSNLKRNLQGKEFQEKIASMLPRDRTAQEVNDELSNLQDKLNNLYQWIFKVDQSTKKEAT